MPQFLNTQTSPEIDKAISSIVESALPTLTANSWAEHLQQQGLSPSTLAQMYVESLSNCKPGQKVKEIRELLGSLGITRTKEEVKAPPTIVINGENIQLNQMLLPERDW